MKIYIAGRISGPPLDVTKPKFYTAAEEIEAAGHTPLNPFEISPYEENKRWRDYMADCLKVLLSEADAIYMLPDWQDSAGAKVERYMSLKAEIEYIPSGGLKEYLSEHDARYTL